MKHRTLTAEEYEAETQRRRQAYDRARVAGTIAAANPNTTTAELRRCIQACDDAYMAMLAPMPVFIEVEK